MAMGASPRSLDCIVDAALVDTGSSTLSTIGERLVRAAKAISARPAQPTTGNTRRKLTGIGGIGVVTIGTMRFSFIFGGREYEVTLHVVPGLSDY